MYMASLKSECLAVAAANLSKCLKLQIGKKSTVGDKPVSRRIPDPTPLDYSRLPLVRGLETIDDYMTQQTTVSIFP